MSKRYGRNQKRAHRVEIERLSRQVAADAAFIRRVRADNQTAGERAVTEFLRREHLPAFREELAGHLARYIAPKLQAEAERLLDAMDDAARRRQRAFIDLRAGPIEMDRTFSVTTIEAAIDGRARVYVA